MTRKLAGFGLAFALAELAAAYLPPLASLLTAALFISLFVFAAFTQRRAARFALPAVAGLLAGLVWSAAFQLAVVKPAQSLAGQTYACTAIVQPDAETSWQPGNVRATLLVTQLDGRKTSLKLYCTDLPYSEAGDIITGQFKLQPLRQIPTACPAMPRVLGLGHPIRRIISGREPRMRCRTGCTTCGRRLPNG